MAEANNHCALNVVIHNGRSKRWAMTERGAASLLQAPTHLRIGPSALHWDGDTLVFTIDEIASPLPTRIRGEVRVTPRARFNYPVALDAAGKHRWQVIAPLADVQIKLTAPRVAWSGEGYLDSNEGDEPLERRIRRWHWSRTKVADGSVVIYDVLERSGAERAFAFKFGDAGKVSDIDVPGKINLPKSSWRIARVTRSERTATVQSTLDDTPFYVRSVVASQLFGAARLSVHESLDLDRFRSPLVQAMLPFRMPRRA